MVQAQMTTNLVSSVATSSTGALVNTTSALNILNGEVAILDADIDSATYNELTANPVTKFVQLIQGTPKSNNTNNIDVFQIGDPAYVKSGKIYPKKVRNMTTTDYTSGTLSTEVYVTDTVFATNSNYGIYVQLDGRRQEREFGQNTDTLNGSTSTGPVLPTDAKDFVFQTIAFKLNQQSQLVGGSKRMVALGVSLDGSGGGVALSTLTEGSTISFMVQNGVTYTMQVTNPLIRSLANQIASSDLLVSSTIVAIDTTTAGNAAKVDALVVVGIDAELAAYEDDVMQVRTEVTLNPKDEFESEGTVTTVYGAEAKNSGRIVANYNKHRAQLNIHTKQLTPYGEYFSEGYSYINPSLNYGSFIVEFYDNESVLNGQFEYEKKATIYWAQTEPSTLSVDGVEAGETAILAFTPTETVPAVVGQFSTWVNANA
jgi:hypothetical protein